MKESILKSKSFSLAVRIVRLYRYLKADFAHKIGIARKELNETLYWLELLLQTEYITQTEYDSLSADAIEIIKMLTTSIKTAKNINN